MKSSDEAVNTSMHISCIEYSDPAKKETAANGRFVYGGERGIRTLDKAFDPILP